MGVSTLNPNAAVFVPSAFRAVEDFSDQWWDLVKSSPWFRDYWLDECFIDPQDDAPLPEIPDSDLPIDVDDFVFGGDGKHSPGDNAMKERKMGMELAKLGLFKWRKPRAEAPRYCEKAPKIVNTKVNPRLIQQPR